MTEQIYQPDNNLTTDEDKDCFYGFITIAIGNITSQYITITSGFSCTFMKHRDPFRSIVSPQSTYVRENHHKLPFVNPDAK